MSAGKLAFAHSRSSSGFLPISCPIFCLAIVWVCLGLFGVVVIVQSWKASPGDLGTNSQGETYSHVGASFMDGRVHGI